MNRLFSQKIWTAAVAVTGGATLYGGVKHWLNAESIDQKNGLLSNRLNVFQNRFLATCQTRVGYGSDGKVTPSDIMLYWGSGSPFSWRIMITLEEKGLSGYKNKLLSMSDKEHKTPEILAINPRGQVPTFKHGGVVINESLAACEFLESVYNDRGTKLLPTDPGKKAVVLQKFHETQNVFKTGILDLLFYLFRSKEIDQELLKTKKADFAKELQYWEDFLSKNEQPYLAGKDFSLADVSLFPLLALMVRLGLQLERKFPHLSAYYKVVSDRPSVKATWPPHWSAPAKSPGILADVLD